MDVTNALPPGFYWYFEAGDEPEVVRVTRDGEVHFCGSEAFGYLPSTGATDYVLLGEFIGPITAPQEAAS